MGRGQVGEWPSGGRARQGQCQPSTFFNVFRQTNDKHEKRIANFVKKSVYSLAKLVMRGVPYQRSLHQHDFHQNYVLPFEGVSEIRAVQPAQNWDPHKMFVSQIFPGPKSGDPLYKKTYRFATCEGIILYFLKKKRLDQ